MEETLIRGTYYLGDSSYVLSEKHYYDVLVETRRKHQIDTLLKKRTKNLYLIC